jgi:hypothetical protein
MIIGVPSFVVVGHSLVEVAGCSLLWVEAKATGEDDDEKKECCNDHADVSDDHAIGVEPARNVIKTALSPEYSFRLGFELRQAIVDV